MQKARNSNGIHEFRIEELAKVKSKLQTIKGVKIEQNPKRSYF